MAKMTLLEMVQDILSDMDSDEVNSLGDTVESQQVSQVIRTTYYEIIDGVDNWPHLNTLFQLTPSGTTDRPTHMQLPDNVQSLKWVKYNKRKLLDTRDKYASVHYKEPTDFIDMVNQRVSTNANMTSITDTSGISLIVRNDEAPSYWTSFDDSWMIFDAYDSAVESTLQSSKTQAFGPRDATFIQTDLFVPDLPDNYFSYLLAEAKSVCFNTLKQTANPKEEQRSKRQRYRLSGTKDRMDGGPRYPNFGRK